MKKVALILLLLAASNVVAQTGPVVTSASFLEWDYDTAAVGVKEFRVYLSRTPGVVPKPVANVVVSFPTLRWPIVAAQGQWYAIVTAITTVGSVESTPSNEVPFFVLEGPRNLRVAPATNP
jgi:hypothetical protein